MDFEYAHEDGEWKVVEIINILDFFKRFCFHNSW